MKFQGKLFKKSGLTEIGFTLSGYKAGRLKARRLTLKGFIMEKPHSGRGEKLTDPGRIGILG